MLVRRLILLLLSLTWLTAGTASGQVSTLDDGASRLLNQWYQEGTAAGHHGDYYDNRDRGHSRLDLTRYPQLRAVTYLPREVENQLDRGAQRILLPLSVIGNSSMASAPTQSGSLPRIYYTSATGLDFLHAQYRANNLYVYPEHRDHDPDAQDAAGFGDLFPTNTPYLIISQGSSGSDRPFVHALVKTLAAFRPGVKTVLLRTRLLLPTLQAIFRQSNRIGWSRQNYLSGAAHPSVFNQQDIDALEMVHRAHAMSLETIPPLVRLRVVDEQQPVAGIDYFEPSDRDVSETLGETPCVIARVVRGRRYERRITVSAGNSIEVNGQTLTFHWIVLRGDANRIEVETSGARGEVARISVPYHQRRPIAPGSALTSNRVDIGVFAESAAGLSAPCFVTFYTLPNEQRVYDDQGRPLEITYGSPGRRDYVDPRLSAAKSWRDVYRYDESGTLTGWRRHVDGKRIDFTADGSKVLKRDASGNPVKVEPVRYVVDERSGLLKMVSGDH